MRWASSVRVSVSKTNIARGSRHTLLVRLCSARLSAGKTRIATAKGRGFSRCPTSVSVCVSASSIPSRFHPFDQTPLHCSSLEEGPLTGGALFGFSTLTKVPPFCPFRMLKRTCWPSQSSVSSLPSCRTIAAMSHLSKLARNENLAVPFLNSIASPLNFGEVICLHEIIFPATTPFFGNFLNKRSSSRGNRSCCPPFFTYGPTFMFFSPFSAPRLDARFQRRKLSESLASEICNPEASKPLGLVQLGLSSRPCSFRFTLRCKTFHLGPNP